jgi:hypothetical protein
VNIPLKGPISPLGINFPTEEEVKNGPQAFGLRLQFSKKLPKEDNHPRCENLPCWVIQYFHQISSSFTSGQQGCQMAYFQTKNPDMGKFLTVLQWKMLVYYVSIWYIFWLLGIFFGYLGKILAIWSSISRFGILYQENLATLTRRELQLKLKVAKTQHIRCTFKAG